MTWSNLVLWNVQIALLVTAAALIAAAVRLNARTRLMYWQALLAVCLLLPLLQPWQREVVVVPGASAPAAAAAPPASGPPAAPARRFGPGDAVAAVLAAGFLLRAAWFGLGLVRLARYRRGARPLEPVPEPIAALQRQLCVFPEIRLSGALAGPVTFGFRNPVVLLPERFTACDLQLQAAMVCHELFHVKRRDWLFTAIEEGIRAVFWFHPAVWWVLGQVQLAREQVVDRETVRATGARERYIDALLTVSGASRQLDLAPAPLFLRRRHLTARVAAIIKEVDMSRRRLIGSIAVCFTVLLAAGWLITGSLPLKAAPQVVADSPGITVTGADRIIHRSPVRYPAEALAARIEGTVVVDAQLNQDGTVADAVVTSGPLELRRAALESVLSWHFSRDAGNRVQVSIQFQVADNQAAPPPAAPPAELRPTAPPPDFTLAKIYIEGLSPEAAQGLRERLPVREGERLDAEVMRRVVATMREYDRHLSAVVRTEAGGLVLRIGVTGIRRPASTRPPLPAPPEGVQRLRVGANVQARKLLESPMPAYPPLAQQARVSGVVQLDVLIGTDGAVKQVTVISGHPLLVPAAMEAVRQYRYAQTLLNGAPAEVVTQVNVPFTAPQ